MSKRFQPFDDFSRGKKPKLDVTISRERPVHARNNNQSTSAAASTAAKYGQATAATNVANFWDDDDDDVILLATQVAESQVAAAAASAITDSEVTFSDFAPNLRGTTSTQQLLPPPQQLPASKPAQTVRKDIIAALFEDDDDEFEFLAVSASQNVPFKHPIVPPAPAPRTSTSTVAISATKSAPNVRETKPIAATVTATTSANQLQSNSNSATQSQSSAAARRQLAAERQMKFLMDRLDVLKKDNMKLQKELGDSKEVMQCKDGETTLLRDELRHLKQQVHSLQMENMTIAEKTKAECKSKLDQMHKVINAKTAELSMRTVEVSELRIRHDDDARRLEMSMCQNSMAICAPYEKSAKLKKPANVPSVKSRRKVLRLNNLKICDVAATKIATETDWLIYEQTKQDGAVKKQRTLIQIELDALQKINAQLKMLHDVSTNRDEFKFLTKTISERIIESTCKVFPEFWSYVHSLDFEKNCTVHRYQNHKLEDQNGNNARQRQRSLQQPTNLYENELAVSLRRYFGILAVMCRHEQLARTLIEYRHGEYLLLQIANDAVAKLGYAIDMSEHLGVLEAFAALLHSLLLNCDTSKESAQRELIFDALKQLVFTRPNAWVFHELSFCLYVISIKHTMLLELCCINSPSSCFSSDRVRSTYRFTEESCLLQVYAGLLESIFYSDKPLAAMHFELLMTICNNHLRFVYNCLKDPPKFITDMLMSYDDEEVQAQNADASKSYSNSSCAQLSNGSVTITTAETTTTSKEDKQSTNAEPSCECYIKLCLSVVTLLYQLLRQWLLNDKQIGTSQVAQTSQIALHVLNILFRDYYITGLFRDSEETTKHYLALICTWLTEYAETFKLQDIQMRFLNYLKDAHFMLKSLDKEGNPESCANDLMEWKRLVNNADIEIIDVDADAADDDEMQPESSNTELFNPLDEDNIANFFDAMNITHFE